VTVHIGEITSEVSGPAGAADLAGMARDDPWEEQARIAAVMDRVEHDRRRTGTGYGDD
jgi:hypothetical protein